MLLRLMSAFGKTETRLYAEYLPAFYVKYVIAPEKIA